jgi:hypothetical protein
MDIAHLMCNDPESISPKLRPASSEEEKGKVAFCAVRARERMERNVMAGTVLPLLPLFMACDKSECIWQTGCTDARSTQPIHLHASYHTIPCQGLWDGSGRGTEVVRLFW